MISNSGVLRQPSRRIVLLSKLKRTSMRLGAMTQSFFVKGEELEATRFENQPHHDPTHVPPKLGFRSFDRVPRNRAPLLIALLLVAAGAAGVFGWRATRDVPSRTARVASSVGAVRAKASSDWVRLKGFVGSRQTAR